VERFTGNRSPIFEETETSARSLKFANDAFSWLLRKPQIHVSQTGPSQQMQSFVAEVDARRLSGPLDNEYGIYVKISNDDSWWAGISSDGWFLLRRRLKDDNQDIKKWTKATSLITDAPHRLRLEMQSGHVRFLLDGKLLIEQSDSRIQGGRVGLYVGTMKTVGTGVKIEFDNFVLSSQTPSLAAAPAQAIIERFDGNRATVFEEAEGKSNSKRFVDESFVWTARKVSTRYYQLGPNREWVTFTAEVDARRVSGPMDNGFGIFVKCSSNESWWAGISSDGYFKVARRSGGKDESLKKWTKSSRLSDTTHRIRVEAQAGKVRLSADGQLLTEIVHSSIKAGRVGLYVETMKNVGQGLTVRFDNFTLMQGGGPAPAAALPAPTSGRRVTEGFHGNRSSIFEETETTARALKFVDEAFVWTIKEGNVHVGQRGNESTKGRDFVAEVDARRLSGPKDNGFGLYVDCEGDECWWAGISSDGFYQLCQRKAGKRKQIKKWTKAAHLITDSPHRLRLVVRGTTAKLYVDGKLLAEVSHEAIKGGMVGLYAETTGDLDGPLKVKFDNFSFARTSMR